MVDGGPCVVSTIQHCLFQPVLWSRRRSDPAFIEWSRIQNLIAAPVPDPAPAQSQKCIDKLEILESFSFPFQYFTSLGWTKLPVLRACFEAIRIFRTTSIWHSHQAPEPNWKRTGSATLVSTELDFLTLRQATTRQSIKTSVTAKIRKKFASQS